MNCVFRAKRTDRVKLMFWNQTYLVLMTKRLKGGRFRWPTMQDAVVRSSPARRVERKA
jgi:transposase